MNRYTIALLVMVAALSAFLTSGLHGGDDGAAALTARRLSTELIGRAEAHR